MTNKIDYEYKEHLIERQAKAENEMLKELREGDYSLENPLVKYNPYELNILSAVVLFKTEEPTSMVVRVKGKTPEADFYKAFPLATEQVLPIVGLYPDYENTVEIYPWQNYDKKVEIKIQTPKTRGMEIVDKIDTTAEYMQDQVMFLCPANHDLAIAVDYAGDVRLEFSEPMVWDFKVLDNGNFQMGSERITRMPYFVSGLYEFSAVGKIYKEHRVPHGYHHDQCILPNGDIVALNCNLPNGTVEDTAVVIDKDTGHVYKTYDFADFIKPGAQKSGSWSDEDWFHCNAVWYDEKTNSLTFSGRHINAMVNIDFDTSELNWIISDPEGWSEEYDEYLFTPVGETDEFEWQYEQHSNLITPLGDVMCFDNHQYGSQNPDNYNTVDESYSRSGKYRIDTETMEIEQLYQYGKERGTDWYSPYICNTKYYNEGHYLHHSGGIAFDSKGNPSELLGAYAVQEDPGSVIKSITVETINDEEVYELEVNSNYYRANKVNLYTKEEGQRDLVLGRGQILGTLGESPVMDYDIPAEETGELLDPWHEGRIEEMEDLFTFYARFEQGDLVLLQLVQGDEVRQYFVPTYKGTRGAMCAGTFLTGDKRDTRTAVNKEGLSGEYEVKILLNDKIYETGVTIKA